MSCTEGDGALWNLLPEKREKFVQGCVVDRLNRLNINLRIQGQGFDKVLQLRQTGTSAVLFPFVSPKIIIVTKGGEPKKVQIVLERLNHPWV